MKTLSIGLGALAICAIAAPASAQSYADDRAAIVDLSNRYMVAVDAGDIETVMDAWADDGVLDWVFGVEHGKDEIREAMTPFVGMAGNDIPEDATGRPRMRHQIINHVIDVDGDVAHTTAYWFAMSNRTDDGHTALSFFGHYEDELERQPDGRWLFKTRTVYNESRDNKRLFYPGLGESDPREGAQ